MLADLSFSKDDPIKLFKLESLKNINIVTIGKLVESINRLQVQSGSIASEDKVAGGVVS